MSEVRYLGEDDWCIEEGHCCAICGDEFEIGDQVTSVPEDELGPRAVVEVHLACGVRTGEVKVTVDE